MKTSFNEIVDIDIASLKLRADGAVLSDLRRSFETVRSVIRGLALALRVLNILILSL